MAIRRHGKTARTSRPRRLLPYSLIVYFIIIWVVAAICSLSRIKVGLVVYS